MDFSLINFFTLIYILLMIILSLYLYNKVSSVLSASIATTLGVLGTFSGLAIALIDFNATDINSSINNLLDGLTTAFSTSIVGIILSIAIKIITNIKQKKLPKKPDPVEKMIQTLENIEQVIKTENQKLQRITDRKFDILNEKFEALTKKMISEGTNSIVSSLEYAVQDFNTKIKEQFGENFKEFNIAIKNLLRWQIENKQQIDRTNTLFNDSLKSIKVIKEVLGDLIDKASIYQKLSEKIKETLEKVDKHLSKYDDIAKKSEKTFEESHKKISKLSDSVAYSINKISDSIKEPVTQVSFEISSELEKRNQYLSDTLYRKLNSTFLQSVQQLEKYAKELSSVNSEPLIKVLEQINFMMGSLTNQNVVDELQIANTNIKEIKNSVSKKGIFSKFWKKNRK